MPIKKKISISENNQNADQTEMKVLNDNSQLENKASNEIKKKKIGYHFLKYSGLTITFVSIAAILIIIGMIIYYRNPLPIRANAGFWVILTGVILIIATVIFGFEKIN